MQQVTLARINQDANEYRFYRLVLPTGSQSLLRQWGRINEYVYEKWDEYSSYESALETFKKTEQTKRQEGYISADNSVFPRSYIFYSVPVEAPVEANGQLNLFDNN